MWDTENKILDVYYIRGNDNGHIHIVVGSDHVDFSGFDMRSIEQPTYYCKAQKNQIINGSVYIEAKALEWRAAPGCGYIDGKLSYGS